jgi:hypothetical protein
VKLHRQEPIREAARDWIAPPVGGQGDRQQANLRGWPRIHTAAQRRRQQLDAEARAEERDARTNGVADQALLVGEPRKHGVVVHTHRPAHGDDQVEAAPIREPSAFVQFNTLDGHAALEQDVLIEARRLAGDVLQDEGAQRV